MLPFALGGAAAFAAAGYWLYATSRASVEIAGYRSLEEDGAFSLREYPALAVARTTMRGPDDAFMRLFGFIDGGNARGAKIPMTAPVFIDGDHTMSFVLPGDVAKSGAPAPTGYDVELGTRAPVRVVVNRFPGAAKAADIERATAELRAWAAEGEIPVEGEPILAFYDAPFIPGFLRRNEVMLRVER